MRNRWDFFETADASRSLTCLQPRRHLAHLPPCQVRNPTANIRLSRFWRWGKFPDSRIEITRANEKIASRFRNWRKLRRVTTLAPPARSASTSPSRVILPRRSRHRSAERWISASRRESDSFSRRVASQLDESRPAFERVIEVRADFRDSARLASRADLEPRCRTFRMNKWRGVET